MEEDKEEAKEEVAKAAESMAGRVAADDDRRMSWP